MFYRKAHYLLALLVLGLFTAASIYVVNHSFTEYEWTELNEGATWEARAGLQAVEFNHHFYLMGGRTPIDPAIIPVPGASTIWGDVWKSADRGKSWEKILESDTEGQWPARAYFKAVTKGKYMYVLGGQNFNIIDNPDCPPFPTDCPPQIPSSDFFNDVWRSQDGVNWTEMTSAAGWEGRAGLSSVVLNDEIYVLGGSKNDDDAIVGDMGPPRIYYNDVWKSKDGSSWELVTDKAPWEKRAGAAVVAKDGYIYLLGGEDGFVCEPLPFCEPPYFNDVWRSKDGANWEEVTPAADWVARPGHQCLIIRDTIVCFGGFGLITNPMDVWVSKNGADWKQVSDSPWNAVSPTEIKYDFAALALDGGQSRRSSIYTFGGDRETFDFTDPTNYLNVDNDVWRFAPPMSTHRKRSRSASQELSVFQASPNPFNPVTTISYGIPDQQHVEIAIYDTSGRLVRSLVSQSMPAGEHTIQWDATNNQGSTVASGVYLYQIRTGNTLKTQQVVLLK